MSKVCDLCGSCDLEIKYIVPESSVDAKIAVCNECGLVQSIASPGLKKPRSVSISSGANWGNIRYGKELRTSEALQLIRANRRTFDFKRCLDIGASRGDFLLTLAECSPLVDLVGIEPDERVVNAFKNHPRIDWLNKTFEEAVITGNFDLIYCCHTLEHVDSPKMFLRKIKRHLSRDGFLFLEVPNLTAITNGNIIEEFFIDKHNYHFSKKTLTNYLKFQGLSVIDQECDNTNLSLLVGHGKIDSECVLKEPQEVDWVKHLIENYKHCYDGNKKKLNNVGNYLRRQKNVRIAVWGAGRIFDSLIKYGDFDRSVICGVIDKHLAKYMDEVNGFDILNPERIVEIGPDVILVCSREYAREIEAEIKIHYPYPVEVITYDQLMDQL